MNSVQLAKREIGTARLAIVDNSQEFDENHAALEAIAKQYQAEIFHAANSEFKEKFFSHGYGGLRNACLALAISLKEDVVFLDDDCVPLDGFYSLHRSNLEKRRIVAGSYVGKSTTMQALMGKFNSSLADFANGTQSREHALAKSLEALTGVSDDVEVNGFSGGNLGIPFETAAAYCFYPTSYRIEDHLYCELAKHFTGERPLVPETPPKAFHKRTGGELNALYYYYVKDLRGSQIGLAIKQAVENNTPVEKAVATSSKKLFEDFDKRDLKEIAKLREACAELESAEVLAEFDKITTLSVSDWKLEEKEVEKEAGFFLECQKEWKKFASEGSFLNRANSIAL
ncbi:MAG: hypothetical protein V1811_02935 [Candidatus Micrarchaeota archaeon]